MKQKISAKAETMKQNKYMTFTLDKETYGVDILKIKEIIGVIDITPVPRMPEFIKGVINLRGSIIPVIDLRLKIGFEERAYDERTCIIIVEIGDSRESIKLGIIVDRVLEVANYTSNDLEPAPNFGLKIDTSFILSMAKKEGKVVSILDIDALLTTQDVNIIRTTKKKAKTDGDTERLKDVKNNK
ncbi:MAG: chemotaxis protein CheW [Spirochaetes bacterium]|nr:chemotaxis protein CheW [Spirochaetota bacterium]